MREPLQLFNAATVLAQLRPALMYPDSYHGDIDDLYRSVGRTIEPLGVSLPDLKSMQADPNQSVDDIRSQLSVRYPDLEDFLRLGELGSTLLIGSYPPLGDDAPDGMRELYEQLQREFRDIAAKYSASSDNVEEWIDACNTMSDRAKAGGLLIALIKSFRIGTQEPGDTATSVDSKRVFLVHGHDEAATHETARFLERLSLDALILREQPNSGRTIIEKFIDYSDVAFAVVLLTGDDRGGPKAATLKEYKLRARQNVIMELGFFLGKLGRERVCVLYQDDVEVPSDYSGVLFIPINQSGVWRLSLAKELKVAGLPVDLNDAL